MSIHLPSMAYCVYNAEQGHSMGSVVGGKDMDIYSQRTEKQNPNVSQFLWRICWKAVGWQWNCPVFYILGNVIANLKLYVLYTCFLTDPCTWIYWTPKMDIHCAFRYCAAIFWQLCPHYRKMFPSFIYKLNFALLWNCPQQRSIFKSTADPIQYAQKFLTLNFH
jgi:hypothetical protein